LCVSLARSVATIISAINQKKFGLLLEGLEQPAASGWRPAALLAGEDSWPGVALVSFTLTITITKTPFNEN